MHIPHKKRWIRAVTGGLILSLLVSLCGLYGQCEEVRHSVVRLHILAHSDSEADQALKLRVRDAVVEAAAGWLDGAADAGEALVLAREALPRLEQVARETVAREGYTYPVKATLCRTYFPTREYGTVTLPAGHYEAVRIVLGDGAGRNWWCVVFPPLCAGAAADRATMADVLDAGGQQLVASGRKYAVKFKVVEWVEGLLNRLR